MKLPVRVKQCAAKAYQCGKSLEPTRTDTRLGSVCVFPERDSKQSEWSGLENVSLVGRVSVTSADVKLRQGLEGKLLCQSATRSPSEVVCVRVTVCLLSEVRVRNEVGRQTLPVNKVSGKVLLCGPGSVKFCRSCGCDFR